MAKFAKPQLTNASPKGWSTQEIEAYGMPADLIIQTCNIVGGQTDQTEWASFHAAVGSAGARLLKEVV